MVRQIEPPPLLIFLFLVSITSGFLSSSGNMSDHKERPYPYLMFPSGSPTTIDLEIWIHASLRVLLHPLILVSIAISRHLLHRRLIS
jgi:hypothetical protein